MAWGSGSGWVVGSYSSASLYPGDIQIVIIIIQCSFLPSDGSEKPGFEVCEPDNLRSGPGELSGKCRQPTQTAAALLNRLIFLFFFLFFFYLFIFSG